MKLGVSPISTLQIRPAAVVTVSWILQLRTSISLLHSKFITSAFRSVSLKAFVCSTSFFLYDLPLSWLFYIRRFLIRRVICSIMFWLWYSMFAFLIEKISGRTRCIHSKQKLFCIGLNLIDYTKTIWNLLTNQIWQKRVVNIKSILPHFVWNKIGIGKNTEKSTTRR